MGLLANSHQDAAALACRMLSHKPTRFILTVLGIGVAFFLAASQIGLMVGWIHTNTALIRHAEVDLWVMAQQTPAFDYGTAIPRHRIQQARSVPGVEWAEGLFMGWEFWQRGDGRRLNVELVGLDKSHVGGPWDMSEGSVACVDVANQVIVDELYLDQLGVARIGENFEMIGERTVVGGISRGVRTFTAAPFVFTSLKQAIRIDKRYHDDEITYVLVRCAEGMDVADVQQEMRWRIPHVEVLTSDEFALRSARYWMLETGIGITIVITAVLGLGVGAVITSQTLFAITQDHLPNYATLLALGFRRSSLVAVVLVQSLTLGVLGIIGGSALFFPAAWASTRTPIPLETTSLLYVGLILVSLTSCVGASVMSLRAILKIDPVNVFRL
jgi:putative ABC transport system permease protein